MTYDDENLAIFEANWMRVPCWRWQRALAYLADPFRELLPDIEDEMVYHAANFHRARTLGGPGNSFLQLVREGTVYSAFLLRARTAWRGGAKWQVEALIMAGATNEQINEWLPMPAGPETYEAYRKLYFDVDDYLDQPGCVLDAVFSSGYGINHELGDCDLTWKMLAYELGVDKLLNFLRHYAGGELDTETMTYLDHYRKAKMAYHTHHLILDQRMLYRAEAIDVINLADARWKMDHSKVEQIQQSGMELSISAILGAVEHEMQDSKELKSPVELLQADPQLTQFTGGKKSE